MITVARHFGKVVERVRLPPEAPFFMNANEKRIKQEQDYIAFLEKRVNSENYKKNVSQEEFDKTKEKLKKAKLVLKILT